MSFIIFLQQHALSVLFLTYCIHWLRYMKVHVRDSVVPYLDSPVRATGDEHIWVEVVPLHGIDRQAVCIVRHQELTRIRFGALQKNTQTRALFIRSQRTRTNTESHLYPFSMQTKWQYATRELISATEMLRFCLFASG